MTKAKPDKAGTSAVPPKSGSALQKLMAFVATRDPIRARAFYRDTLGLELVSEDQFALAFDIGGTMLRVTTVQELTPAAHTPSWDGRYRTSSAHRKACNRRMWFSNAIRGWYKTSTASESRPVVR